MLVTSRLGTLATIYLSLETVLAVTCGCGNLDLSKWKLQLPIGDPGKPQTVSSADLCKGFTNPDYFFFDSTGALVMKVPGSADSSGCVTTTNSKHCRTELRETTPSVWSPNGKTNRLAGDLKVTKNDNGEVVVGQIHIDDSISSKPVAELYYASSGKLRMGVQTSRDGNQKSTDIDTVPVGQRFTYEIRYEGNVLSVGINGKTPIVLSTFELNAPDSYFKAGNYDQSDNPIEVHFYKIQTTHA
ncbi:alginate lyase [Pochonia chlamydosporia 170]|uniref:Alginate lyase n=1 Tax=Pochonia chlamydosporia 170 TaxID=1380566 RepID=A0A179F111_METCM|nr:alginate lyase [Pochonia chlamydosporia 170]OAQ59155.1 alginate lyase [Pochonia chlamydosporia 170]